MNKLISPLIALLLSATFVVEGSAGPTYRGVFIGNTPLAFQGDGSGLTGISGPTNGQTASQVTNIVNNNNAASATTVAAGNTNRWAATNQATALSFPSSANRITGLFTASGAVAGTTPFTSANIANPAAAQTVVVANDPIVAELGSYSLLRSNWVDFISVGFPGSAPTVVWRLDGTHFITLNDENWVGAFGATNIWTIGPTNDSGFSSSYLATDKFPSGRWEDIAAAGQVTNTVYVYFPQTNNVITNSTQFKLWYGSSDTQSRYVNSVIGDDNNDGLSTLTPYRTMSRAFVVSGVSNVFLGPGY